MENYNFWQDLLDTYQSLPNLIKVLWILVPPLFILGLVALILFYKNTIKRIEKLTNEFRDINSGNFKKKQ